MARAKTEKTEAGWQYILPGAERRRPPRKGWLRYDPTMDLPARRDQSTSTDEFSTETTPSPVGFGR